MEPLPPFSFCDILCTYICLHRRCRVVVKQESITTHLVRKHGVTASLARRESEKLLKAIEGKSPDPIAARYFSDPLPRPGEEPLPALPILPMYDIIRCPYCDLFFSGVRSCRAHIQSRHTEGPQSNIICSKLSEIRTTKGQVLFLGPARIFLPVTCQTTTPNTFVPPILPIMETEGIVETASDELFIREKNASLTCSVLRIAEFLDDQNLSLQKAVEISNVERSFHSKIVSTLLEYIRHFASMQPPVPISIVEGIKIRNGDKLANFSLSIEDRSKKRYASLAARIIRLVSRLEKHPLSRFPIEEDLYAASNEILQNINSANSPPLTRVHTFFRILLLQTARASAGEMVMLEGVFKVLVAGYTCRVQTKRVRVGDADDASHIAAAMQYFTHVAALGEFFVTPIGFGERTDEDEEMRFKRIQRHFCTEVCSPAAYIRTVLLKTKSVSAGENAKIDFVPCPNHHLCGTVQNLEVQLNSDESGSLGFTVRKLRNGAAHVIRVDLMQGTKVPANFAKSVLSFPDKLREREPGYHFGEGPEARTQMRVWAEDFAKQLSVSGTPIFSLSDGGAERERKSKSLTIPDVNLCSHPQIINKVVPC